MKTKKHAKTVTARVAAAFGPNVDAIASLKAGLELCRANDDRPGALNTLTRLGETLEKNGDLSGSAEAFVEASRLYLQLLDGRGAVLALSKAAELYQQAGDTPGAIEAYEKAAHVCREKSVADGVTHFEALLADLKGEKKAAPRKGKKKAAPKKTRKGPGR